MRVTLRERDACKECGHVRFPPTYAYTCDNQACGREMTPETAQKYSFHYSFDFEDHLEKQYCSLECFLKGMREWVKRDVKYFSPNYMFKELSLELVELLERLGCFERRDGKNIKRE